MKGKWKYLYRARAIDKHGRLIDFFLSDRRNAKAAKRFLGKALRTRKDWPPLKINTDKNDAYPPAIRELKQQGKLVPDVEHRQVKYLNNRLEADHGGLKRLIKPTRGFQSMKTAYATIKGFEVMRMLRKRQCILLEPGGSSLGILFAASKFNPLLSDAYRLVIFNIYSFYMPTFLQAIDLKEYLILTKSCKFNNLKKCSHVIVDLGLSISY